MIPSLFYLHMMIHYRETLRYEEKNGINWLQFDPFLIPLHNCSNECLPPLKAADLLSNLLIDTSFCTKGQY